MSVRNRFLELDVLRGFLAIFVVVGHVLQQFSGALGWVGEVLEQLIYSFHMAAFFFVAGFCSSRFVSLPSGKAKVDFLLRRAERLLVPYVVWGGIYFLMRAVVGTAARMPYAYDRLHFFLFGYNPDGAMWFVWSLFVSTALLVPLGRFVSSLSVLGLLYVLSVCTDPVLRQAPAAEQALASVPVYLFFLALGVLARLRYESVCAALRRLWVPLMGMVVFVTAFALISCGVAGQGLWHSLTALSSIVVLLALSRTVQGRFPRLAAPLSCLGVEAMAIYVLGEPVKVACRLAFARLELSPGLAVPLMAVCIFSIALLASRVVLRRVPVLTRLLLGVRQGT